MSGEEDDLIFETDIGDETPVIAAVMEGAGRPAVDMTVPPKVDAHGAHDWNGAY